ncbi:MAG: RsmD family RNA methyltransferase [Rickettsiales bacterium]|nr:RsmD family RNA methyltransferase [Rickettsiales bacterium]
MKITGGIYRGKTIEGKVDRSVRPTTGRIREAIFNLLRHGRFLNDARFIDDGGESLVAGRHVVDIFCGTGALGLEALSRGAERVTLVDQDPKTLVITQANVRRLSAEKQVRVLRSDSTQLPQALQACHLAFLDPPYGQGLMSKALESLVNNGWMARGAVVVAEHDFRDHFDLPLGLTLLDQRTHDKTSISILQYGDGS